MLDSPLKLAGLGLCALISAASFTGGYLRLQPTPHHLAATPNDRTINLTQVLGQATVAATPQPSKPPTLSTATRNIFQATASSSINLTSQTNSGTICIDGQCRTVPNANQSIITTCVNGQCTTTQHKQK